MGILAKIACSLLVAMLLIVGGAVLWNRMEVLGALKESGGSSKDLLDDSLRGEMAARASMVVSHLAQLAVDPVERLDLEALNVLIEESKRSGGATQIEILNRGARILADGRSDTYLRMRNELRLDPMRRRAAIATASALRWQRNTIVAWAPIPLGDSFVGSVWAEFSLEDYKTALDALHVRHGEIATRAKERVTRRAVVFAVAGAMFTVLLAVVLALGITRPIRRLTEVVAAAAVDLSVRAPVTSRDEIGQLASRFNTMVEEIDSSREALRVKDRLEREMEIAASIQTRVLPRNPELHGLRVAARMVPADEVGGDYYDIIPDDDDDDGCWVAIGDVTGHGLNAGLVMVMAQAAVATAICSAGSRKPSVVLRAANRLIYENVRKRLQTYDHMTATLLRHDGQGKFLFAGAHEEIIIWRCHSRACEIVDTPGIWLGLKADISGAVEDRELQLNVGDRLVLYSDGIIQEVDEQRVEFGMERLCELVGDGPDDIEILADTILTAVEQHAAGITDDRTLVVIERIG